MIVILIVLVVCCLALLANNVRLLLRNAPEPCQLTHWVDLPRSNWAFDSMLSEAQHAQRKAEQLAAERLRMLHRLNDIYTNRSNDD